MTEQQIKEIEESKSEAVKELYSQWKVFNESPYKDTYITLYNQLIDWNSQLKIIEIESPNGKLVKGRIDIFADKDTKEFDRAFKYFSEITTLLNALDEIRLKMTPQQQKDVIKDKKLKKNESIAV